MEGGDYKSFWKLITVPFSKETRDKWKDDELAFLDITKQVIKDYTKYLTNSRVYWETLTEYEKAGVRSTMLEMSAALLTIALLAGLKDLGEDDEDIRNSKWFNFLLYELDAQRSELITYTPYGMPNEGAKIMASPAATWGLLQNSLKVARDVLYYIPNTDEENKFNGGQYNDKYKLQVHGSRMIPFLNQVERWYNLEDNNKAYKLW